MQAILAYIVSNLPSIISGISTYGPAVIKLIENNGPAISAVANQAVGTIGSAVAAGASVEDAIKKVISSTVIGLLAPHKMTPEEEMAWMNAATPGNDPSQENSKYTIG